MSRRRSNALGVKHQGRHDIHKPRTATTAPCTAAFNNHADVYSLLEHLKNNNSAVTNLDLKGKIDPHNLSKDAISKLANAIAQHSALREIDLRSNNRLNDEHACLFALATKYNCNIHTFKIKYNSVTVAGMKEVAKTLTGQQTLKLLKLSPNMAAPDHNAPQSISGALGQVYAELIRQNPNLEVLNIASNPFTTHDIQIIAEAVADHPGLKELILDSKYQDETVAKNILESIIEKNPNVKITLNLNVISKPDLCNALKQLRI